MVRRLPTPSLFPYTTLFRSLGDEARQLLRLDGDAGALGLDDDGGVLPGDERRSEDAEQGEDERAHGWSPGSEDRKSTRLNSSHANISYAVFCLKKKNNTNNA